MKYIDECKKKRTRSDLRSVWYSQLTFCIVTYFHIGIYCRYDCVQVIQVLPKKKTPDEKSTQTQNIRCKHVFAIQISYTIIWTSKWNCSIGLNRKQLVWSLIALYYILQTSIVHVCTSAFVLLS